MWKEKNIEGYFTSPIPLSNDTHKLIIWINSFDILKHIERFAFLFSEASFL